MIAFIVQKLTHQRYGQANITTDKEILKFEMPPLFSLKKIITYQGTRNVLLNRARL